MNLKQKLQSMAYTMIYIRVDQMAHLSERRLNVRGVVTSGMAEIDKSMIHSKQNLRVSVLKLASMYKQGIDFDIINPAQDIVPIYNQITDYLTDVGKFMSSAGFKTLAEKGRVEYEKLLLKDAFTLEHLADGIYNHVCTYDLDIKVKNKTESNDILDLFKRHITSSLEMDEEDLTEAHIESFKDVNMSPHRLALRSHLDEATIYKYEDMTEFF